MAIKNNETTSFINSKQHASFGYHQSNTTTPLNAPRFASTHPKGSKVIDMAEERIEVRPIKLDDLVEMDKLFESLGLNDGVDIFRLIFLNSDSSLWQVALNEKGKIVGAERGIKLDFGDVSVIHLSRLTIHPDYRRLGIVAKFGRAYGDTLLIVSPSKDAIAKFPRVIRKFSMKLVSYFGHPEREQLDALFPRKTTFDFTVASLRDEDTEDLLAYDRTVLDYDRRIFMLAWCQNSKNDEPYSETVIAKSKHDGRVLGFGTIRQLVGFLEILPLYADSSMVAEEILKTLTHLYLNQRSNDPLRIFFDAGNRTLMEYVKRFGFQHEYTHFRAYAAEGYKKDEVAMFEKYVNFDKVFVNHEYWPA